MLAFLLAVPVAYAGNIFILTENVIPENTALPESHINDVSWDIVMNSVCFDILILFKLGPEVKFKF